MSLNPVTDTLPYFLHGSSKEIPKLKEGVYSEYKMVLYNEVVIQKPKKGANPYLEKHLSDIKNGYLIVHRDPKVVQALIDAANYYESESVDSDSEPVTIEVKSDSESEPELVNPESATVEPESKSESVTAENKTKNLILKLPEVYQLMLSEVFNFVDKDSVLLTLSNRIDDIDEQTMGNIIHMMYDEFMYLKTRPIETAEGKWTLFELKNNVLHFANNLHLMTILVHGNRLSHRVEHNNEDGKKKLQDWEEKILNS